jgi:hypothetical protein
MSQAPESVWADPVMRLTAAAALVCVVWFGLVAIHPVEPTAIGWALSPVGPALAALVCWRAGGSQTGRRAPSGAGPDSRSPSSAWPRPRTPSTR